MAVNKQANRYQKKLLQNTKTAINLQAYIILTIAVINTVRSLDKKEVVGVLLVAASTIEYPPSLAVASTNEYSSVHVVAAKQPSVDSQKS